MNLHKLSPWNWFKSEDQETSQVPVSSAVEPSRDISPVWQMHRELDRWMDNVLRRWNFPVGQEAFGSVEGMLRPSVDIAERDDEYRLSIEVPGVDRDDLKLSLDDHRLVVEGEKRQESRNDDDRYQRVERVYGRFRRVLDLPGDANVEDIRADFANGVLTVTLPRDPEASSARRDIPIQPS
ncbi:Hsp20/alpha crystallin family protein [Aidingimonas halophila]|uniref:HSP20 family protein n=1 Tax=Aidingimonas halophila TaxID=574349 RepID=A0A1H3F148_9GAMM|nr:Hsp20/alpha crystallin family protein [Aidingimonas halophila]GHC32139.1 heat-shock protein Hsp20 [Aidingimonas halophila]SDX84615.1 HSP20 family protein [Aidingimonas halophila]